MKKTKLLLQDMSSKERFDLLATEIAYLELQNKFIDVLNYLFIAGCSILAICIVVNRMFVFLTPPITVIIAFIVIEIIISKIFTYRNKRQIQEYLDLIIDDNDEYIDNDE